MSRKPLSAVRETVRQLLRDEFDPDIVPSWADDELDVHIDECRLEISGDIPRRAWEPAPVTANSKLLNISGIEDLIRVESVEYTVGQDPRNYRNVTPLDYQTIEMNVSSVPSTSGTSGTLTGTLTFTAGSATVTGSGTDFDGDLAQDCYIKPSGGTRWYRVYSVEGDTSLTLDEPVKPADAGADTENASMCRYGVAVVHYETVHLLTDDESTLSPQLEKLLTDGAAAYAALAWVSDLRNQVREAQDLFASIHDAVDAMLARIGRARIDLAEVRPLLTEHRDNAISAISDVDAQIAKAIGEITRGKGYINTISVGGKPQTDHLNSAAAGLQVASKSLQKATAYLNADAAAGSQGVLAGRELSIAQSSLNQAIGFIREANVRLSIASAINSYQVWGERKLAAYRAKLKKLTPMKTYRRYSES